MRNRQTGNCICVCTLHSCVLTKKEGYPVTFRSNSVLFISLFISLLVMLFFLVFNEAAPAVVAAYNSCSVSSSSSSTTMAFPCCFSTQSQLSFKASFLGHGPRLPCKMMAIQRLRISRTNVETKPFSLQSGQISALMRTNVETELFTLQSGQIRATAFMRPSLDRGIEYRRKSTVSASCLPSTQIASSVFTLGTAAVLPFYTLMIVAPKAEVTKKAMASSLPYIALGLLYAYLLYLSWTPDTIRLMCSGKNFLPELPAIAKLFSNEMTLASAWIHLLAIDLFAARQVFHDGLQENVETRHSISLCLFFCPIGVFTHFLTKAISKSTLP